VKGKSHRRKTAGRAGKLVARLKAPPPEVVEA
jgi:hypothetical protein